MDPAAASSPSPSVASRIAEFFRPAPSKNGHGGDPERETKSGVTLSLSPNIEFVSGDGGKTITRIFGGANSDVSRVTQQTAYAAAAYCYIAVRYRMRQIAEAPLVVQAKDPAADSVTTLPDHPLQATFDDPSPDYDLSTLVARTVSYVDITGQAVWAKDVARGGMVRRLTPFHAGEFSVDTEGDRIYGRFELESTEIEAWDRQRAPEEVVFFQEPNPFDWHRGISKVDVCLNQLNLGKQAIASVKDILRNALFPSVIIQTAPDWNPDDDEWRRFKQMVDEYARREHKGGPFFATGGGSATQVGITLKDMIPTDILRSVESVVAATFAIPSIVLQFQVGLENSPWSQMSEARRMGYEDSIEPTWREYASTITRQLLHAPTRPGGLPLDDDRLRMVAFDTSNIRALQVDVPAMTEVAVQQERIATLNERRMLVGLEPVDDPRADEIPELQAPQSPPDPLNGDGFENPFAADMPIAEEEDEAEEAGRYPRLERKATKAEVWRHFALSTKQATDEWLGPIAEELAIQGQAIAALASRILVDDEKGARGPRETKEITPESEQRFLRALGLWLEERGIPRLRAITYPLVLSTASAGVRAAAAQIGVGFGLLQEGLFEYAARETEFLADVMGQTTGEQVGALVQSGLEEGETVQQLTSRIQSSASFSRDRAQLVARTETTRAWNGAQREQLQGYEDRTGTGVRKTWLSARDDRVRPEHEVLDGTTLDIDGTFANGLTEPGEPNCRCTLIFELVEDQ